MISSVAPGQIPPELLALVKEALRSPEAIPEHALRQLYIHLDALSSYENTHPIECYRPIPRTRTGGPHQLAFHQSTAVGRGAFGGNQSGKTRCGSMEVAMRFTGVYPPWYPAACHAPRQNVGRITVKDFPHSVAEVIEPALLRDIPARFIREKKTNNKGFLTKLASITGSRFDIVTHDMDTTAVEGWQGHWAWFDEPPPRDKFIATLRGLVRFSGRWWITCTPLNEPWMFDEIYTNPKYFMITIDMRDNPYLTEEAIAEFESRLTEEEKESRIHGRFMHLAGLVYKEFDPATHIRAPFQIPAEWPRWHVVDPHDRRPFAMLWFAVDPLQRIWIYDEWPRGWFHEMKSSTSSLKDYVHIIREIEMGQKITRRIIDGRACKVPIISGERQASLLDAFDDLGLHFEPSYITQTLGIGDPGHMTIKERLRISPVTQEPSLFIFSSCKNVIYSMQHNTWAESRRSDGSVTERPTEFAKDFLDLIRYGLMDDPRWLDATLDDAPPRWHEASRLGGTYGSLRE